MSALQELAGGKRVTDAAQVTRIVDAVRKGQDAAINAMNEREKRTKENEMRIFHF